MICASKPYCFVLNAILSARKNCKIFEFSHGNDKIQRKCLLAALFSANQPVSIYHNYLLPNRDYSAM